MAQLSIGVVGKVISEQIFQYKQQIGLVAGLPKVEDIIRNTYSSVTAETRVTNTSSVEASTHFRLGY